MGGLDAPFLQQRRRSESRHRRRFEATSIRVSSCANFLFTCHLVRVRSCGPRRAWGRSLGDRDFPAVSVPACRKGGVVVVCWTRHEYRVCSHITSGTQSSISSTLTVRHVYA